MDRRLSLALAVLFSTWLCLPLAAGLLGLGQSSAELEQRDLESFPGLPRDAIVFLVYPATVNRYLQDHFGLKRYLAPALPALKFRLGFLEGEVHQQVIIGRQRWLFYAGDNSIRKHAGQSCIGDARLRALLARLVAVRAALAPGAKLVFAIAPDKQSIYPEYLPGWMRRTGPCSDYDRVMAAARQNGFDAPDLRPALLRAKAAGEMVYYRDDSHWTSAGVLAVLQVLLAHAGLALDRDAMPRPQEQFIIGDLARLLDMPLLEEKATMFPAAPAVRQPLEGGDAASPAYRLDYGRPGRPSVLLLGDSFSISLAGLLGYAGIGSLDWMHFQPKNEGLLLARSQPDVVIVEMAERALGE